MSHWRHYEHEADIGIEGIGVSKVDAFIQAALALTAVITNLDNVDPKTKVEIICEAPNDELIFVDWLNALVYEMANRKMLFSRFELDINSKQADTRVLYASAWGEKIEQTKHQPAVEIKGATYTTLSVYTDDNHLWHAQTVVDV